MIENERQYKVTRAQIAKMEAAQKQSRKNAQNLRPELFEAVVAGIQSQIDDLRAEMQEYEDLRTMKVRRLPMESLANLGEVLIKARIARGYTQADFAERLEVQPQQVQKYESTRYESASLKRLLDVVAALEIDIQATIDLGQEQHNEGPAGEESPRSVVTRAEPPPRTHFITNPSWLKQTGVDFEERKERARRLRAA